MNIKVLCKKDNKVIGSSVLVEVDALNLLRKALLAIHPMEETSADLHAMNGIESVKQNKVVTLENKKQGTELVFIKN